MLYYMLFLCYIAFIFGVCWGLSVCVCWVIIQSCDSYLCTYQALKACRQSH